MLTRYTIVFVGLFFAVAASAGVHVGNESVVSVVDLPGSAWTISWNASSAPDLARQACGGGGWTTATKVFVNGAFVGWTMPTGDACGWAFDMGGPLTVTVSDGAGRSLTAPIDPAPVSSGLSPEWNIDDGSGAPAMRLVVGDSDALSDLIGGLSLGDHEAAANSSLADALEAALGVASLELTGS